MMRLRDATLLATTKLQTHKIRLGIAIIVSALLLSIISAGLFVSSGVFKGIELFSDEGLNSRYLVATNIYREPLLFDAKPELVKRANEIRVEIIKEKTAKAKQLGITYDSKTEPLVLVTPPYPDAEPILNISSEAVERLGEEIYEKRPMTLQMFKKTMQDYDAKTLYIPRVFEPVKDSELIEMKDGKERFGLTQPEANYSEGGIFPQRIYALSDSLSKPFELVGKERRDAAAVPVVVPFSYAEKALGYKKMSDDAKSSDKLERVKNVQRRVADIFIDVCYRNSASKELVSSALLAAKEAQENKNNKDYQKPSLVYGLPAPDSCGAAPVMRDVRTVAEKRQQQKMDDLAAVATERVEPAQRKVRFQVVGLSPDMPTGMQGFTVASLIKTIAGSNLADMWIVPESAIATAPDIAAAMPILQPDDAIDTAELSLITEFATPAKADKFGQHMKCPIADCENPKRSVYSYQFGSNSVVVSQIKSATTSALTWAIMAVVVIASIIMMSIVGRMIADGRRETAVFRAIGAKRGDIALIYAVYTLIVSAVIGIVGVAGGIAIASFISSRYGQETTAQALLSFGSSDISREFPLMYIHWYHVAMIIGLAVAAGVIGMILPLLRNVRRNPINDMRDD